MSNIDAYLDHREKMAAAYRAWEDNPCPETSQIYLKFVGPSDQLYKELTDDEKKKLSKISHQEQARYAPGH